MRVDWFLYHVASGHAFFTGLALVIASVAVWTIAKDRRRTTAALGLLGALFVAISATPLPWVVYGVWAAILGAWVYLESRRLDPSPRRVAAARIAAIAACVSAGLLELPYHVMPRSVPTNSAVGVIGD